MTRIALLGAGFSRNWGGLLASEVFDDLLGQPEIRADRVLSRILWDHQAAGGFENALAQVQQDYRNNLAIPEYTQRLGTLQTGIDRVFAHMDRGFARLGSWEFTNERAMLLRAMLVHFDAIFTLNQDLLFERFYFDDNVMLESGQRWNGAFLPGLVESKVDTALDDPGRSRWTPRADLFELPARSQPYFKLHGSWRWFDGEGRPLMVMGGSKAQTISGHEILRWYHGEFVRRLSNASQLLVIGYGFADAHINDAILEAGRGGRLRMFIVDPLGVDVANPDRRLAVKRPSPFQDIIAGGSPRSLREIFATDAIAQNTLRRFLELPELR